MSDKVQVADYMTRFKCIGPDCEDTCCQGWRVNLTAHDVGNIGGIAEKAGDQDVLDSLEMHPVGERHDYDVGRMRHDEAARCTLLREGWCKLHRDYGESALPTVCATFPRIIIKRPEERLISFGRLSCPEVVRLALFAPEGPILVPDPDPPPDFFEVQPSVDDTVGLYQRTLESLTHHLNTLLADQRPLQEQLYGVIYLIKRLENQVSRGMTKDVGSAVSRLMKRFENKGFRARLAEECTELTLNQHVNVFLLANLNAAASKPNEWRFENLRRAALQSLGRRMGNAMADTAQISNAIPVEDVIKAYMAARDEVDAHHGAEIEHWMRNFARTFWGQYLYLGDTELRTPLSKFLIYLGVIRFIFYCHPTVLGTVGQTTDEARRSLQTTLTTVVQTVMKRLDGSRELLIPILKGMRDLGISNVSSLGAFIKL